MPRHVLRPSPRPVKVIEEPSRLTEREVYPCYPWPRRFQKRTEFVQRCQAAEPLDHQAVVV